MILRHTAGWFFVWGALFSGLVGIGTARAGSEAQIWISPAVYPPPTCSLVTVYVEAYGWDIAQAPAGSMVRFQVIRNRTDTATEALLCKGCYDRRLLTPLFRRQMEFGTSIDLTSYYTLPGDTTTYNPPALAPEHRDDLWLLRCWPPGVYEIQATFSWGYKFTVGRRTYWSGSVTSNSVRIAIDTSFIDTTVPNPIASTSYKVTGVNPFDFTNYNLYYLESSDGNRFVLASPKCEESEARSQLGDVEEIALDQTYVLTLREYRTFPDFEPFIRSCRLNLFFDNESTSRTNVRGGRVVYSDFDFFRRVFYSDDVVGAYVRRQP